MSKSAASFFGNAEWRQNRQRAVRQGGPWPACGAARPLARRHMPVSPAGGGAAISVAKEFLTGRWAGWGRWSGVPSLRGARPNRRSRRSRRSRPSRPGRREGRAVAKKPPSRPVGLGIKIGNRLMRIAAQPKTEGGSSCVRQAGRTSVVFLCLDGLRGHPSTAMLLSQQINRPDTCKRLDLLINRLNS